MKMEALGKNRSPWAWIPTLYLAEGLPYVAVNIVSVIVYKRMGISNADIALYNKPPLSSVGHQTDLEPPG
jgi:hypothetical protein